MVQILCGPSERPGDLGGQLTIHNRIAPESVAQITRHTLSLRRNTRLFRAAAVRTASQATRNRILFSRMTHFVVVANKRGTKADADSAAMTTPEQTVT